MSWIATYTGVKFSLLSPQPEQVHIEDIAHSLSHLCRFAGATSCFYSVAQHSVLVSLHCPPEYAFVGLMHDAAEAYCLDMPRPLKYLPGMEVYRAIEKRIHQAICARFCLPTEISQAVKSVDEGLLMTERNHLLGPQPEPWDREMTPMEVEDFVPWPARQAKYAFLSRFHALQAAQCGKEVAA